MSPPRPLRPPPTFTRPTWPVTWRAYQELVACLGNQYAACTNPLYYLSHQYGLINSYTYPAILAGLHFQCGGGLESYTHCPVRMRPLKN